MATQLDLEEQEQLDQLKAFWKKFGTPITWLLILALAAFAGHNFWEKRKQEQAIKSGVLYDELDRAAGAGDVDKVGRVFADMKDKFATTAFTQQAALLAAKVQLDKGKADAAVGTLTWAAEHAAEPEYRTMARLRLAGILLDQKKPDDALKQLAAADSPSFAALVADRRGDVLASQGKVDEAKAAYLTAWKGLEGRLEYRRMVEAKLVVLGAPPEADAPKKATS